MTWNPWQIIVAGAGLLAFLVLGAFMHWFDPTPLYVSLVAGFGLIVASVAARITKALEQSKAETAKAKSEVEIEKARSQMPPALQGAKVEAVRLKMPTIPDVAERAPGTPATPPADAPSPTTDIKVEVKS